MMKKVILMFFAMLLIVSDLMSQVEKYQAAYLYNFTKYIDWCQEYKSGDFEIAVIGESSVIAELQNMAKSKKVINQNIVVKKYQSASEISDAQMIFISSDKSGQLAVVLAKIGNKCALVVSDKEGAAKNGAAISFGESGGKIVFDINKGFFTSHKLSINTQLVNLARNVY